MHELELQAKHLNAELQKALERLGFDELWRQKTEVDARVARPDLWNDPQAAQELVKQQAKLKRRVAPWQELKKNVEDLMELSGLNDETMKADLEKQLEQAEQQFTQLK